jgi:hypothetical protein
MKIGYFKIVRPGKGPTKVEISAFDERNIMLCAESLAQTGQTAGVTFGVRFNAWNPVPCPEAGYCRRIDRGEYRRIE